MRNMMETNQKMAPASAPATITNNNVSGGILQFLKTPKGRLGQIEFLVIFTAFLLLFLVVFGLFRRRCSSSKFRFVIFTAYTLSTYVITYALGLMNEAPFGNELFPVWAVFVMIIFGSADSLSAFSLEDNEQWKRYNLQLAIKSFWLGFLIGLYTSNKSSTMISIYCLFFILLLKSDERAQALMAASQHSLERNTKVIADYMRVEQEKWGVSGGEVDPVCMRGYYYLVRGEEERSVKKKEAAQAPDYRTPLDNVDQIITVEKVWQCEGGLLSSEGDPHNKLKDMCLSFALFKLLRLRYSGYSLPQEVHERTWNLIRHGLLSKEDGYKRAFRVIEVELTFLFDFFYTKYSIIFQPGRLLLKLLEFIYVAMGIWATISILKNYRRHDDNYQLGTLPNGLSIDVVVTSLMIISFIIVELMQFVFMGFSKWVKVIWICKYVQKKSWQENVWIERAIRAICWVQLIKPWEQKLHQYSFLESYSYKPPFLLNNVLLAAYIDQTGDGRKESAPVKLPEEVKEAVFRALKSNCSNKLENGQSSLRRNKMSEKLSWACRFETQTQVIMVWHIATSFCKRQQPVRRSDSPGMRRNFLVATSLSNYLAYLVGFAPRLLPDHPYVAECTFDQVIIEARNFFQGCKRMEDQFREMERKGCLSSGGDETVIDRGARLGIQLANDITHKDMIWKILADFWAELMLYVAPSDNAKAHAEHLTRGGEFVTHLWALLSHAGIKRDPPSKQHNALVRSKSL